VTREETLAAAGTSGAPVFVTGLGEFIDPQFLEELASASGGDLSLAATPASLEGLYATIGGLLRHQYLISIDASGLDVSGTQTLRLEAATGGTAAVAERSFEAPPPVEPPAPVPVDPPVEVVEPPVVVEDPVLPLAEEASSSLNPLVFIGPPLLLVGGVFIGLALIRRRRKASHKPTDLPDEKLATILSRAGAAQSPNGHASRTSEPSHDPLEPAAQGWLVIPTSGDDRSFPIEGRPLTVGSSSDCDVVLPNGSEAATGRVRVWRRDGRFMLHNLSRGESVRVGGKPVSWVVLEDGDEIDINGSRITFQAPSEPNGGF
jgi:hypothetical protein